ncbi:MAG: UTRA domain-containing protein [Betaproteobacteria bacterium]|nr:UTRA domain-containing protein [Betaproteobacteria bacterium]
MARYLGVKKDAPVLAIERMAQTYDGTPVEYRERCVTTERHAYLNFSRGSVGEGTDGATC